jgi:hypothetical protein
MTQHPQQPPPHPAQPPYPQQPPPGYYIPVKKGPSEGRVILWVVLIVFVIIPLLIVLGVVAILQLT